MGVSLSVVIEAKDDGVGDDNWTTGDIMDFNNHFNNTEWSDC